MARKGGGAIIGPENALGMSPVVGVSGRTTTNEQTVVKCKTCDINLGQKDIRYSQEEIEQQFCDDLKPADRDSGSQIAGEDESQHHGVCARQYPPRCGLGGRASPTIPVVTVLVPGAVPVQPRPEPLMQVVERHLGRHLSQGNSEGRFGSVGGTSVLQTE